MSSEITGYQNNSNHTDMFDKFASLPLKRERYFSLPEYQNKEQIICEFNYIKIYLVSVMVGTLCQLEKSGSLTQRLSRNQGSDFVKILIWYKRRARRFCECDTGPGWGR